MSNKKIIIIAIFFSVFLIFSGWYYSFYHQKQNKSKNNPEITEPGVVLGNPSAPVVIEEYTNLLCEACAYFQKNAFLQIYENYIKTGKVKLEVYVTLPYETGKAALCALEQNKFFDYIDYALDHQLQIKGEQDLKDFAVNIGLNEQKFNECYSDKRVNQRLEKWNEEREKRGVNSTPTFFINGQKLIGAQPFKEFQKIIEEKLKEKEQELK